LKKVWRKHQFLQDFVVFQYMGYGTNMQWVYCVQTDEDRALHPAAPNYFNGVITGVNLEMMERPELLEPPVVAEQWEETTVTCKLNPHKTVRKLKIMSMVQFAKHVQNVQHVPFEFWEILRGVIGAGTDGFVYRTPHLEQQHQHQQAEKLSGVEVAMENPQTRSDSFVGSGGPTGAGARAERTTGSRKYWGGGKEDRLREEAKSQEAV